MTAGKVRFDDDTLAEVKVGYSLTHRIDISYAFMSWSNRVGCPLFPIPLVKMNIGTTNANHFQVYPHLAGARCGSGYLLKFNAVGLG